MTFITIDCSMNKRSYWQYGTVQLDLVVSGIRLYRGLLMYTLRAPRPLGRSEEALSRLTDAAIRLPGWRLLSRDFL
jgi:hypothetical protein